MTNAGFKDAALELAEWHDAVFEQLMFHEDGSINIIFKHMCTYHKISAASSEIWSSRVLLRLEGVSKVVIEGDVGQDEYLYDGGLLDTEGNEIPLLPVDQKKKISSAWLGFAGKSGSRIDITATSAILESVKPLRYIQDWQDESFTKI